MNSYEYDEFGQVIVESENLDNVYKYSGYIYDESTQNYYLQSRYYNPAIQRFISEDTVRGDIEDPLSLNLYTYTHNNPLKYTDPDGHVPVQVVTAITGALIDTGIHFISDLIDDGKINSGIRSYVGAALEGAIVGATMGFVGPNAGMVTKALASFSSETIGNSVNQLVSRGRVDFDEAIKAGAFEAITDIGFETAGKVIAKRISKIKEVVSPKISSLTEIATKKINDLNDIAIKKVDNLKGIVLKKIGKQSTEVIDKIDDVVYRLPNNLPYREYKTLKKYIGKAGEDIEWHHIVEQSQIKRSGFTKQQIHNTNNVIALDKETHKKISGLYSSKQKYSEGKTVREWLSTKSYEEQYKFGIDKLREFGVEI